MLLSLAPASVAGEAARGKAPKGPIRSLNDLVYAEVEGKPIRLDLRVPTNTERLPLVVWIHGGGWVVGDKRKCKLCWLARRGFAVASINYRLLKDGIYPAQIHDCKAAIRWLRANADRYGYDASRIAVAGASAGGHLAALLGTTGGVEELEGNVGANPEESSRVQAVISVSGFSDLATSYATNPDPRIVFLIGGTPEEKPRESDRASPVHFVGAGDPPLLIIHGERDPVVNPQQAVQLQAAYEEQRLHASLEMLQGIGHHDLKLNVAPLSKRIESFLTEHLTGSRDAGSSAIAPEG